MRTLRVFTLMAGLTALLGAVGQWIGGSSGAVTALVFAGIMNFGMFLWSDRMVLRMYRARVVDASQAPGLYRMIDRLRQRAGLPMPTVAVAPHQQPNAFATGRSPSRAVVCVTEGLLEVVNESELEGVLAHELAHIKNRDTLTSTIAATIAGVMQYVGWIFLFSGNRRDVHPVVMIAMWLLAPLTAVIIQLAISRSREYVADADGAEIVGSPDGLIAALQKLEATAKRIPLHGEVPAQNHMFIVQPLSAGRTFASLFSTHPPVEKRIAKLRGQ